MLDFVLSLLSDWTGGQVGQEVLVSGPVFRGQQRKRFGIPTI
jgi:hypothetical protein